MSLRSTRPLDRTERSALGDKVCVLTQPLAGLLSPFVILGVALASGYVELN